MTGIILKVLSFTGITLLLLLGILLLLIVLVLFCPVCYRAEGHAAGENKELMVRVTWLLGLVRILCAYPKPGGVKAKILFFTIFDSKKQKKASTDKKHKRGSDTKKKDDSCNTECRRGDNSSQNNSVVKEEKEENKESNQTKNIENNSITTQEINIKANKTDNTETPYLNGQGGSDSTDKETKSDTREETFTEKAETAENIFEKIKYTIQNIYDKIKKMWDNVSYYKELFHEENTKCLWNHVRQRLGKILRNIRPRHFMADITFGAGSPDTTGYIYAAYSIFSPFLGKDVRLTPDFQQAIVNGSFKLSGHITCIVLVSNVLSLLLDKKMKLFLNKLKAGRKKNG